MASVTTKPQGAVCRTGKGSGPTSSFRRKEDETASSSSPLRSELLSHSIEFRVRNGIDSVQIRVRVQPMGKTKMKIMIMMIVMMMNETMRFDEK
jgi:hypothetical protein